VHLQTQKDRIKWSTSILEEFLRRLAALLIGLSLEVESLVLCNALGLDSFCCARPIVMLLRLAVDK
jgi:hypothetical protein